ncbi:type VII secretion-associated serine protease mycosin [Stackebrandtia endophytica]|uniref:Type VII secretion-associated serine protease mycosin n=1 Tax=Stackebrandtia endophytica TaxID=1496996 RepID=A0A543AUQ6_9ACTN|nr:type VII secretion-associated serine protease mycosin [Stackebrandtia endophytica]TQL76310.1 type VII secretion-associated serine protease mycosin [Stackebrandtia endophytica]
MGWRRLARLFAVIVIAFTVVVVIPGAGQAADCDPEFREEPMPQKPWPLERLRPERLWPLTTGEGVTVAVIDSGVGNHPILDDRVVAAYDLTKDQIGARCDMASHGTLVAGIIAGKADGSSPFYGMAPDVEILSYRVIESIEGSSSRDSVVPVVEAINHAVDSGADVINLSLTAIHTAALENAIERAHDEGVVVVAAAGNSGATGNREYPAAYDDVIAVAGIGPDGGHVESSSVRDYVDIAAPGTEIDGPAPSGGGFGRREEGGTSFAAPYVSATAALLKAYDPDLTPDEITHRLLITADHPPDGWNSVVGHGELNPYRALTTVLSEVETQFLAPPMAPVPPDDPGKAMRDQAFVFTICAVGLVILFLCAKVIVPRGRSRGWQCG